MHQLSLHKDLHRDFESNKISVLLNQVVASRKDKSAYMHASSENIYSQAGDSEKTPHEERSG